MAEQRLIDAIVLMDVIRAHDYPLTDSINSIDRGMFTIGIQQAVDETPTVDAVEVVRCRECIHTFDGDCPLRNWARADDDYCSYGECKGRGKNVTD